MLKGLDFVLRNVGSALRVVVTSRVDPLLPLYRYRLAGHLARSGPVASHTASPKQACSSPSTAARCTGFAGEPDPAHRGVARPGLRLAALSLAPHPDPGQFVKDLMAEDNPLICYLVDEVLNIQPPQVREVLLSTCILEHVSADAAVALTGDERAAGILASLARGRFRADHRPRMVPVPRAVR